MLELKTEELNILATEFAQELEQKPKELEQFKRMLPHLDKAIQTLAPEKHQEASQAGINYARARFFTDLEKHSHVKPKLNKNLGSEFAKQLDQIFKLEAGEITDIAESQADNSSELQKKVAETLNETNSAIFANILPKSGRLNEQTHNSLNKLFEAHPGEEGDLNANQLKELILFKDLVHSNKSVEELSEKFKTLSPQVQYAIAEHYENNVKTLLEGCPGKILSQELENSTIKELQEGLMAVHGLALDRGDKTLSLNERQAHNAQLTNKLKQVAEYVERIKANNPNKKINTKEAYSKMLAEIINSSHAQGQIEITKQDIQEIIMQLESSAKNNSSKEERNSKLGDFLGKIKENAPWLLIALPFVAKPIIGILSKIPIVGGLLGHTASGLTKEMSTGTSGMAAVLGASLLNRPGSNQTEQGATAA